jgi:hypothetical protein
MRRVCLYCWAGFLDVAIHKTYLEESNMRIADLEDSCRELKEELESQGESHNERLGRLASEQDQVCESSLYLVYAFYTVYAVCLQVLQLASAKGSH